MPSLPSESKPNHLRIFTTHGIDSFVSNKNGESIGTCPFCNTERKYYVNEETGKWNCFVCGRSGNPLTFLRQFYDDCLNYTTEEQYQELAEQRKYLTTNALRTWGLAFNQLREEWVAPGFFQENKSSNELRQLYRWTDYQSKDFKRHMWSTPIFEHCLYGVNLFDRNKSDVWITEGPWDALALYETFGLFRANDEGQFEYTGSLSSSILGYTNVIALPSLTTFTELWAQLLKGKRVFLCLDNDYPKKRTDKNGKESIDDPPSWKALHRISGKVSEWGIEPKEMYYVDWTKGSLGQTYNPNLPEGYDIRDLLGEGYSDLPSIFSSSSGVDNRLAHYEQRANNLSKLYEYVSPIPENWIDPALTPKDQPSGKSKGNKNKNIQIKFTPCDNWNTLVSAWKDSVVWYGGVEKTLACMLACTMSTMFPGTQLWLRVISPPSTGKSILCDAMTINRTYTVPQSNIRGFFSGMRPSKKAAAQGIEDLGMVIEIAGKTFITKDGDTILQAPERARIMSEARDLYDGKTKTHFRTGISNEYEIRTTWILCGTERLREINDNDLGERFLDCIIMAKMDKSIKELKQEIARKAIHNMRNLMRKKITDDVESLDEKKRLIAKKLTGGYVDYLCKNGEKLCDSIAAHPDQGEDDIIESLAEFVSYMRARPGKQDENPQVELHARLAEQLFRLTTCLTAVLNQPKINARVLRFTTQVAFDTAQGTTFDMTRYMWKEQRTCTYNELFEHLQQKDAHITELLRFLVRVGAYTQTRERLNRQGTLEGERRYGLSDSLRTLCNKVFQYDL